MQVDCIHEKPVTPALLDSQFGYIDAIFIKDRKTLLARGGQMKAVCSCNNENADSHRYTNWIVTKQPR